MKKKTIEKELCYREQLSVLEVSYSTLMRKLFFLMAATNISLR